MTLSRTRWPYTATARAVTGRSHMLSAVLRCPSPGTVRGECGGAEGCGWRMPCGRCVSRGTSGEAARTEARCGCGVHRPEPAAAVRIRRGRPRRLDHDRDWRVGGDVHLRGQVAQPLDRRRHRCPLRADEVHAHPCCAYRGGGVVPAVPPLAGARHCRSRDVAARGHRVPLRGAHRDHRAGNRVFPHDTPERVGPLG